MSTRLQVIVDESELLEIREAAWRHQMTVAEWVRQALRKARREDPTGEAHKKLETIRAASRNEFPTADIGQMLGEIEAGYRVEPR